MYIKPTVFTFESLFPQSQHRLTACSTSCNRHIGRLLEPMRNKACCTCLRSTRIVNINGTVLTLISLLPKSVQKLVTDETLGGCETIAIQLKVVTSVR